MTTDDDIRVERAKLIRDTRKARGLTQDELARRAGLSQSGISMLENGERGDSAQAETLRKIELALGMAPGYLSAAGRVESNDRIDSLDRFLRSPWAENITPDEVAFLRGILSNMKPDYSITDHSWFVFLQTFREIARTGTKPEPEKS